MGQKNPAPILKEQHKDNAIEVIRNEPYKTELSQEELRHKAAEARQREREKNENRPPERSSLEELREETREGSE